jgi:hypothetical protein
VCGELYSEEFCVEANNFNQMINLARFRGLGLTINERGVIFVAYPTSNHYHHLVNNVYVHTDIIDLFRQTPKKKNPWIENYKRVMGLT